MREKLTQDDRTWNATQLSETLEERLGIEVTPEAVRQHLLSMGYSWKRTRYVPSKPPDSLIRSERQGSTSKALKRGGRGRDRPEVPRRERLVLVPAPELHLDAKGSSSPAPGWEPVGFERKDQPHRNPRHRGVRPAIRVPDDGGFVPQRIGGELPQRSGGASAQRGQTFWWWSWTTHRFTPPGWFESARVSGKRRGLCCTGCQPTDRN